MKQIFIDTSSASPGLIAPAKAGMRQAIEIIFLYIFFAGTVLLLWYSGQTNVRAISPPKLEVIDEPHDAFDVWKGAAVRGRTLYLFDRHLSAEPRTYSHLKFSADEFTGGLTIDALCSEILSDGYDIQLQHKECGIPMLNEILQKRHFFSVWNRTKRIALSKEAKQLTRTTKGFPPVFNKLSDGQKRLLLRRNRLILEETYPAYCPRSPQYKVENDNYMYLAIYQKMVNKIYHVVSDDSWPEVEHNLRQYPYAFFSNGRFRMAIDEGVPVTIMRLQDLQSSDHEVLASINIDYWLDEDLDYIADLFKSGKLKSDLVTVSGHNAETLLQKIGGPHE